MRREISPSRKGLFNFFGAIVGFALLVLFVFSLNALFASRTPQTTSHTDPTAGWKVYTDLHTGFSIKFPNDWYQEENPDFQQPKVMPDALETRVMFANFPPPFLGPAGFVPEGCRLDVLVASTDRDPTELLKADRYKRIGALSSRISETVVVFNGIEGIKRSYLSDKKAVQQTRTVVLLPGSKNLFALYFWKEKDEMNTTCDNIFATMFRTFKILK